MAARDAAESPAGLWLLCPMEDPQAPPQLDRVTVSVIPGDAEQLYVPGLACDSGREGPEGLVIDSILLKALQKQVSSPRGGPEADRPGGRPAQGRVARREERRPHRRHLRDLARRAGHPGRGRLGPRHRLRALLRGQRPHRVPVHRRPRRARRARRATSRTSSSRSTRSRPTATGSSRASTRCRCPRWPRACSTGATTRCGRSAVPRRGQGAACVLAAKRARTARSCYDFTDPEWNTRFLGDLYQDLSEARAEDLRAAADAGVRRGVHPRLHARPGDRGVRPEARPARRPRGPAARPARHRPGLRLRPLPARRVPPPAGGVGRRRPPTPTSGS